MGAEGTNPSADQACGRTSAGTTPVAPGLNPPLLFPGMTLAGHGWLDMAAEYQLVPWALAVAENPV